MSKVLLIILSCCFVAGAQPLVHAHNDYEHEVPFWMAFSAGCASIEADIFLDKGQILVAHNQEDLKPGFSLENLYLKPLNEVLAGSPYEVKNNIQLLIDIKTEAYSTLENLVRLLRNYPKLIEDPRLKIVISGNRPRSEDYIKYPSFIWFDYQQTDLKPSHPDRVALISLPFHKYSSWNGKGRIIDKDERLLKEAIDFAHELGKPVRFWGTPDSPTSWFTFAQLGIDYINTDRPFEACNYLKDLSSRLVKVPEKQTELQLDFNLERKLKPSVILMIGDGNGLAQISSGIIASKGSTNFARFNNIGLMKTNSADDLVTDSAAGATALASGSKTKNRYIGVNDRGQPMPGIMEITKTYSNQFINAIITTDEISGATPAAFYGHVLDRDSTAKIVGQLEKSSVDWFIAGGAKHFKNRSSRYNLLTTLPSDKVSWPAGVLAAEGSLPSVTAGRGEFLTGSLAYTLNQLEEKNAPFFLMVENGHIDGAGHANNAKNLVAEELDFDKAIGIAMKFIDAHPETLLIVTADHETGGVSIPHGTDSHIELDFQGDDHSGIMVPVFAYGLGAENFRGILDNTEIFGKILSTLGVKGTKE